MRNISKKKQKAPSKPYWEMNLEELREATKQYDKPLPGGRMPGRPLTAAERAFWEKVKRGRGRAKTGGGAGRIPTKRYEDMTAAELGEATKEFDREFVVDTFRPMTRAERAEWERAKRRPGRPRVGNGAERISVTVEKGLLARADAKAKEKGISRAELIARGLMAMLAL